ncbi:substrate-binding domain-containing protein [uncultured Paludibaculum sp.]|uniref:substrate-binding domain-containing protein n=1 Tax=uncultured Paludibaculum sp. TaxID=1765020 RepID=UPI002AAC2B23|nr:substrate-binding domain-containing protein [uncultured Paludibaculum sp.]
MRRRAFLAAGAAGVTAACRRSGKRRIAVIPKGTSHLFWVSVQVGALAAGKQLNVEILWNGPATETDFNRQIQIIDSMVAQRVDGIAVAVSERQALAGPIDRAVASGIPVTVFDSGVDTQSYMTYVGTDNVLAGRLAARTLAEILGGKGKVAVVLHMPGSLSTMDRESGFKDEVEKKFPGLKIVAEQFGMSDRAKSRAAAENILAAHPDLDAFFTSTEPSATGTVLALKSRGLERKVKLVTVDSSENLIDEMRSGVLSALVAQDPFGMAFQAVKSLVDKLDGKQPPKRIELEPRVITAPDLDKPEVQQLLKPDIRKYL